MFICDDLEILPVLKLQEKNVIQQKLSKFAFKIKLLSSVTLIKCYTMYIYMCVYNCFIYQLLEFHSSFGSKLIIIIVFDSMESGLLICQINLTKQFMKIASCAIV